MDTLTPEQTDRYRRQLMVRDFGDEQQQKLLVSRVGIVGCGALGSLTAMYLAGAGVGTLYIYDGDTVDISNLHRQIFYTNADIGKPKAMLLAARIDALNPDVHVEAHVCRLDEDSARKMVETCDLVIDATDNSETKYMLERVCESTDKPFIVAGVNTLRGQVMTCLPGGVKFSDVFPPSDELVSSKLGPTPIFGPTAGVAASLMVSEAIKLLTGIGETLSDRLLTFDLTTDSFRTLSI